MPSWKDMGNVWGTLRELDVNNIREESERPLFIACAGAAALFEVCSRLLYQVTDARYGSIGTNPLGHYTPPVERAMDNIRRADLLVLLVDGRQQLTQVEVTTFDRLDKLALPLQVVVLYSDRLPDFAPGVSSSSLATARIVALPDPEAANATPTLTEALLAVLPGELHLSAARRLPALRAPVARDLIDSTSFSNAAYSLASGLPEQVPILNMPFAAADMIILTKNQAILVYKLALCHGAPADFNSRIREVLPVVGGGYVWRQLARSLVGLIPLWGLVPKVAIAYAGTYTTGVVAWRWYANAEAISGERLQAVSQEALALGREQAQKLFDQARDQSEGFSTRLRNYWSNFSLPWPGKKRNPKATPPELMPPSETE